MELLIRLVDLWLRLLLFMDRLGTGVLRLNLIFFRLIMGLLFLLFLWLCRWLHLLLWLGRLSWTLLG